jgi:hypothetical protein
VRQPDERCSERRSCVTVYSCHPLLHFVSAEDHGWSFTLFDRGKIVSGYRCDWEDDITVNDSSFSREALQRLVPSADPELLDEFERRMHPRDFDELLALNRSRLLAQVLGLEHYEWLAYDYLASTHRIRT